MRNDCKLWCEGVLKSGLQKFSVDANVSSGLLDKGCMKYIHKRFLFQESLHITSCVMGIDVVS